MANTSVVQNMNNGVDSSSYPQPLMMINDTNRRNQRLNRLQQQKAIKSKSKSKPKSKAKHKSKKSYIINNELINLSLNNNNQTNPSSITNIINNFNKSTVVNDRISQVNMEDNLAKLFTPNTNLPKKAHSLNMLMNNSKLKPNKKHNTHSKSGPHVPCRPRPASTRVKKKRIFTLSEPKESINNNNNNKPTGNGTSTTVPVRSVKLLKSRSHPDPSLPLLNNNSNNSNSSIMDDNEFKKRNFKYKNSKKKKRNSFKLGDNSGSSGVDANGKRKKIVFSSVKNVNNLSNINAKRNTIGNGNGNMNGNLLPNPKLIKSKSHQDYNHNNNINTDNNSNPFARNKFLSFQSYQQSYNVHKPKIKKGSNQFLVSQKWREKQLLLKKGVLNGNSNSNNSVDADLDAISISFDRGIDLTKIPYIKLPSYKCDIPRVLIELKKKLNQCDGLKQRKIFHISIKNAESKHHIITSLMKKFFINIVPYKVLIFLNNNSNNNTLILIEKFINSQYNNILINNILNNILNNLISSGNNNNHSNMYKLNCINRIKSILYWLWDLLSDTVEYNKYNKMSPLSLSQAFIPYIIKLNNNNNNNNRLINEKLILFFKKGIEWRLYLRTDDY